MSKINVANLIDSPYRDRAKFPIDQDKVNGLMESIDQTGFWDNLLVRCKDNMLSDGTAIVGYEHMAEIIEKGGLPEDQMFELAYGHHRIEAVRHMSMDTVDLPVRYIADEVMLRIMANENKEGYGAGISSKLETVRQVKTRLEAMLDPFDSFEEYSKSAGEDPFFSTESFKSTKKDGAGAGTIKKFLGKEWKSGDVRIPTAVINCIDKGYVIQEKLERVPSLGIMEVGIAMISHIREGSVKYEMKNVAVKDDKGQPIVEDGKTKMSSKKKRVAVPMDAPDWCEFFKAKATANIIELCSARSEVKDKDGTVITKAKEACTVAALTTKKNALVDKGALPDVKANAQPLDINRRTKQILFPALYEECAEEDRAKLAANLKRDLKIFVSENGEEGFKEWSGYGDLVDSIANSIEAFENPVENTKEQLKEVDETVDNRDSSEYEPAADVAGMFTPQTEEDGTVKAIPVGQEIRNFISVMQAAETVGIRVTERASEVDLEAETVLKSILDTSLTNLLSLYGKLYGKTPTGELCSGAMAMIV